MDIRKIRHADILAKEGNFARAARALNLTQPALSRSIKALEEELGLQLFDRLPGGTRPTAAGMRILGMGETVLRAAHGIEKEAMLLRAAEVGELHFGIGPMLAPFLKNTLPKFYAGDRQVNLQIVIEPISRMRELLLADQIEFFISATSVIKQDPDVEIRDLSTLQVGYYVRSGHPLGTGDAADRATQVDYILVTPRLNPLDQTSDNTLARPFQTSAHIQCDNIEVMKDLALSNDAILLAFGAALEPELSRQEFRRLPMLGGNDGAVSIGLVKLAGRSLSPAAAQILETLQVEHFSA